MKAGVAAAAGVSLATGKSDVVVNGALFGNGNGHFASSLLVDKEVRAEGSILSGKVVNAKTGFITKGTVTASKTILSMEKIHSRGTMLAESTLTTKGQLNVQLALNAAGSSMRRGGWCQSEWFAASKTSSLRRV